MSQSRSLNAALIIVSGAINPVAAHEIMMTYVAHAVHVVVGPSNIDVTVELTFNELVSLEERKQMDLNRDGWINDGELAAYLARLGPAFASSLELTVDGNSVKLFDLYEPELDLLGAEIVGPAHHVLRLSFFARTRSSVSGKQQQILLHDRLWANAPALCSFHADGTEGVQVQMTSSSRVLSNQDLNGNDRSTRIVSVRPPPSSSRRVISN